MKYQQAGTFPSRASHLETGVTLTMGGSGRGGRSLDNEIPSTALALTFTQECFLAIKRQKVPFSLKLMKPVMHALRLRLQ